MTTRTSHVLAIALTLFCWNATAADIEVRTPAGGNFVVKDASASNVLLQVQGGGPVTIPYLTGAGQTNRLVCFDAVSGQLGQCLSGALPIGPIGPIGPAGASGPQGPAGPAGVGLDTGSISGEVSLCGLAVARTLVYIPGRSFVAYTGATGSFQLDYVPGGTYSVVVEAPGNHASTIPAVVISGQTTNTGITTPIDFSSDPQFCGNCGISCGSGQTCSGGACVGALSCVADSDCAPPLHCSGGICVLP